MDNEKNGALTTASQKARRRKQRRKEQIRSLDIQANSAAYDMAELRAEFRRVSLIYEKHLERLIKQADKIVQRQKNIAEKIAAMSAPELCGHYMNALLANSHTHRCKYEADHEDPEHKCRVDGCILSWVPRSAEFCAPGEGGGCQDENHVHEGYGA